MADDEQSQDAGIETITQDADAPLGVVGIGVCAASFPSLVELFSSTLPEGDAAYLIAVRQKDGLDVGAVVEALGRDSRLPVKLAANGDRLEADHIYVGAPDDMITIEDGHIRTRPAAGPVGHRGAFDSLLISLAEHAHERTVVVLLSGLGSEGAAGIVATKKYGGLSIAEQTDVDLGLQGGSDPGAVADLHLPVERIADEIKRYIRNLRPVLQEQEQEEDSGELEVGVTQIATILRNVTSHDFHGYKRGTFVRRIRRRMQVMQIDGGIDAYIGRLRADREEVQHLFQDLLIGVTQFFRDPAEFEVLERELPRLFENKGPDDHFRVWVLGCATGEEAYSIAILLREHMATLDHPPEVQIFATDLDARALSLARAGRYSDTIANHIRPDRLERWFLREGDTYCVSKELREMCIFSPHNIVKDAPFSRIDILSCRNLLIYLNAELQNRVIPIFHFSLRPEAVLFLGSSENVSRHQKLFAPIDRKSRVFRRLDTAIRIIPDFPLTPRSRIGELQITPPSSALYASRLPASVSRQAETIAERYAPAYVIVDAHGDILHFSGRTGRYLEPSAGAATLSLPNLVHRDLRLDVRSALQRAVAEGRRVDIPRLTVRQDDHAFGVNVFVEPLSSNDVSSLVVVFQDLGPVAEGGSPDDGRLTTDEHVQRLEAELRVTRDRLQATIEELESTNEELKSSNEEYQSINEELQSANEEMETSKEELQSVNEELQTVNGELAHRVSELGRTNSDLKNLLESTQIATVFLDNDLRVRNFTPAATDVFHLLETDVGRPLDHVVSRVVYPELQDDVRRVLKTLVPVERQVADIANGRNFAARVLPYRSVENYISGAVVTFTDLSDLYRAEEALRDSEERARAFLTASGDAIYRMSPDWTQMRVLDGRGFIRDTGAPSTDWMQTYIAVEDRDAVRAAIDEAIAGKTMFEFEHRVRTVDGTLGWTHSRAVPILDKDGQIVEWFGAATDITDLRHAFESLREAERWQQVLIGGIPQLVWRAADGGEWSWASPQWTDYTGQSEVESHGQGWLEPVHPDDREVARAAWAKAAEQGGFDVEYRICHAVERSYRWFRTRATPVRDQRGAIVEWLGTSTDVDEMRSLQKRQEVLVAELQHRVRNMLTVVRSVFARTVDTGNDLEEVADHFKGRLDALARTQVIVTRSAKGTVNLEDLIRDELLSVGADTGGKLSISGPEVVLGSKMAESIGLAIHELTTNAVKYGALKVPGATLQINWTVNMSESNGPRVILTWIEEGVPAVPPEPTREGFGRELIEEALPYRLGAETKLEFLGGGVRCTISVPLPTSAEATG
ncbi:CheR family methyltransferase [Mangrovicella endophytica]|uniref:CheR family methyltransferase n=1 Tax=Mangrovicella endophytica TaxID=2066697 RepID=UPI000C9E2FB8|nr:CheR family methyltransferase [Mangrovicella endophytica]